MSKSLVLYYLVSGLQRIRQAMLGQGIQNGLGNKNETRLVTKGGEIWQKSHHEPAIAYKDEAAIPVRSLCSYSGISV